MSKASTSCFRVTLIVAIVCFAVVAGHAEIISELTGTFDVAGGENFGTGDNEVLGLLGSFGVGVTFSPPANLPSQTTEICFPIPTCTEIIGYETAWNGSAIGGTMDMELFNDLGQEIATMRGWMTGGVISGFRKETEGIEDIFVNEWQFDYTYRGIWSSGWWSEGSASIHVGSSTDAFGTVTIATFTPEPGTIALLSTGLVCGWRSLRRRNRLLGLR